MAALKSERGEDPGAGQHEFGTVVGIKICKSLSIGGQGWNRTSDTRIFSCYLGLKQQYLRPVLTLRSSPRHAELSTFFLRFAYLGKLLGG